MIGKNSKPSVTSAPKNSSFPFPLTISRWTHTANHKTKAKLEIKMKQTTRQWVGFTAGILSLAGYTFAANIGGEKYTYDASGNIIEKSIDGKVTKLSYDASNKVTSLASPSNGSEQIGYDEAGRPTSYKDASGQPTHQFNYGYADKVIQADNAGEKAEFYYNAEGQLVAKSVAEKFTPYVWDGNVLAAEGTEAFINERHITGGVPVIAGNQAVIVSDYLGNTLSQGNQRFGSTAYGDGLEGGRFTGKLFVKELGSYVFQYRSYSPGILRWTSSDPSGFSDGTNTFAYVKGDPINNFDMLGLDTNWIFNGEVTNATNCAGTQGWTIKISADGDTIQLKNSSGVEVWKHEAYTEAASDSWKASADAYIAAHPGSTKIIGLTALTEFDLPVAKSALDIGVEDADFVVSSPYPVSKESCRGAVLTLPGDGKIGWANWTIYEK